MDGMDAVGSRKPGMIGCWFRNSFPVHSGDARIRSSRAPSGFLPNDFMVGPERVLHDVDPKVRSASPAPVLPESWPAIWQNVGAHASHRVREILRTGCDTRPEDPTRADSRSDGRR